MSVTAAALWGPLQLGLTATVLVAVPTNGINTVSRAVFTNMDNVPVSINVWVSRQGAVLSNANCVVNQKALSANESWICPELAGLVLVGGDILYADATIAAMINATGSGWKQ